MKRFALCFLFLSVLTGSSQSQDNGTLFSLILKATYTKDFFTARDLLSKHEGQLATQEFHVLRAIIANAFNAIEQSEASITLLSSTGHWENLVDSLKVRLLNIRQDNAAKSYDYKKASTAIAQILKLSGDGLSENARTDYNNSLKLWTILAGQPKQHVTIPGEVRLSMQQDVAGLNNLTVTTQHDSIPFIFDTGANISTASRTTAYQMGMHILPDSIQVGTITGQQVYAQLAVCPQFSLGAATIQHAVFLVFDDQHLAFPQIDYQINGIIGFPVMEALEEIQISQDGHFIIRDNDGQDTNQYEQNMAFDQLSPLVRLEGHVYNFDTGADQTMLFERYFEDNKSYIESHYERTDIAFSGAGGQVSFPGYHVDFHATINGSDITLSGIPVVVGVINDKWIHIYGNIGQDLILEFEKMIINFNHMYIRFQ